MEYIIKDNQQFKIHLIKNKNFKSISFKVNFVIPFNEDNVIFMAILSNYINEGTKNYNSLREIEKRKRDLYNVSIIVDGKREAQKHKLSFGLSMLEEQYTEKNMIEESLLFLKELIFNIDETNNLANSNKLELAKTIFKKAQDEISDNPYLYAFVKTYQSIDEKEYTKMPFTKQNDLDKVDEKNLIEFHNNIINNSNIDFYVIGDFDNEEMEQLITKNFNLKSNNNDHNDLSFINHNEDIVLKDIVEEYKSIQSNLNMIIKIRRGNSKKDNIIKKLYNIILGGSATSKLFTNIREKHSLAYTCSSSLKLRDNFIMITSGIDKNNYEKTKELIKIELSEMEKGNFLDQDLENAKLILISEIKERKDYQLAILYKYMEEGIIDEEEEINLINSITKEDIVSLTKDLELALIFFLKGVAA